MSFNPQQRLPTGFGFDIELGFNDGAPHAWRVCAAGADFHPTGIAMSNQAAARAAMRAGLMQQQPLHLQRGQGTTPYVEFLVDTATPDVQEISREHLVDELSQVQATLRQLSAKRKWLQEEADEQPQVETNQPSILIIPPGGEDPDRRARREEEIYQRLLAESNARIQAGIAARQAQRAQTPADAIGFLTSAFVAEEMSRDEK